MADVISGGVSTLPGKAHHLPEGTMCDDHPDRPAVANIQGETDSMGCEVIAMCQECLDEMRAEPPTTGICDWCKCGPVVVKPRRDYEEGMYGRVYDVCQPCADKENKRLAEEMEAEDAGSNDYPDDDYDDYEDERVAYSDLLEAELADHEDGASEEPEIWQDGEAERASVNIQQLREEAMEAARANDPAIYSWRSPNHSKER